MSALIGSRMASEKAIKYFRLPLGANVAAWQGARACFDSSAPGAVLPAKVSTTLVGIGEFAESVDNTGGAAGAKLVNVDLDHEIIARWYDSVTGGGAVTAASLGLDCYWADDHTVTMTSTGASKAGRVWGVDAVKGALVEAYTL